MEVTIHRKNNFQNEESVEENGMRQGRWELEVTIRHKNNFTLRKKQTLCFLNLYNFRHPSTSFQLNYLD
ncbi:hypothetical protein LIV57_06965 [Chryseobacterium sp. X308]|nr:hypothetical protein [Chryseobacterium sp. X308]